MCEKPKDSDFVSNVFIRHAKKGEIKLIQFGKNFWLRPNKEKIEYLIKLASSLNHAAQQIQKERDELNNLLFAKEAQLKKCRESRTQERAMIHGQLTDENAKQQALLKENQELRSEIKELENANIN